MRLRRLGSTVLPRYPVDPKPSSPFPPEIVVSPTQAIYIPGSVMPVTTSDIAFLNKSQMYTRGTPDSPEGLPVRYMEEVGEVAYEPEIVIEGETTEIIPMSENIVMTTEEAEPIMEAEEDITMIPAGSELAEDPGIDWTKIGIGAAIIGGVLLFGGILIFAGKKKK